MLCSQLLILLFAFALCAGQEPDSPAAAPQAGPAGGSTSAVQPAIGAPVDENWLITAECRMVIVPQKTMLALLPRLIDPTQAQAAWDEVQQAIEQSSATLLSHMITHGVNGKPQSAKDGEELRYSTEFDPPQVPDQMPRENAAEVLKHWPIVGITPTAFEARQIGQVLEITGKVDPTGKWIACDLKASHTRFLRWASFDAGRMANGERLSVQQPNFHVMENITSVPVRSGVPFLIGIHQAPAPEQGYELFLGKVSASKKEAK